MVKRAEKVAREARMAAERWRQYFHTNIQQYHAFHDFVLGKQWTDEESDMLKTYKKIPLQFNKLATLVNTLLGEQQQNTPQLEVVPLGGCDEETAAVREAIIKNLMFTSDAKTAYQVAASQAFIGGFGAFAVMTDYTHDKSFDQDIMYRYFKDATKCYWDVGAEHTNKIDGMRCGWLARMSRTKLRQLHGKTIEEKILPDNPIAATREEVAAATSVDDTGEGQYTWADNDSVTIQHDFKKTFANDMLYKLSNGRVVNQSELDELIAQSQQRLVAMGVEIMGDEEEVMALYDGAEPVRIEGSREYKRPKIVYRQICGDYVLDETEFPSDMLPLVYVDQASYYDKHGKQVCRPFVIDAKDAQRYLNYLGTQSAYVLKVSRYDQWIGSKKNVASNDTAQIWCDPLAQQGMLTYDESPNGDKPWQVQPPELSQSLLTQYQRAMEDLYTSTGLYPSRLGQEGNEISGAAIDARTRQGSYSTFAAFNAINRAIAAGGEVLNTMIPRVYDAERVMTLMMPDEGQKTITINQQLDEYGELVQNDIRKGTFQVRLVAGASYEGQKQQALDSLNMILQANPQLLNIIADLYAENLPLMNTIELKNRLRTLVPPQILEAGKKGKSAQEEQPQGPSPEEQMMQMQQEQMQMEAQFKMKELELKEQELQLKAQEMQAEIEREAARLETERLEVAAQLEEQQLRYMAETDRTRSDAAIAHADNLTKLLTQKHHNKEQ
jgi:hypothetical protein